MKILSAVRHSGKTHHSKLQNFSDAEEIVANEIGWLLHLNKKEFLEKIYPSPIIDEHELMLQFSVTHGKFLKIVMKKCILVYLKYGVQEVFGNEPIKPNVLVTIDEERHKQNLLKINQNHM